MSLARVGHRNARVSDAEMKLAVTQKGVGGVKPLMPASLYGWSQIFRWIWPIGTVERLEGNQFRRIRREVQCVLLVLPLCCHMLNFVGGTVKFGSDEPWTGEGIDKLINLALPGVGSSCETSKNSVTDRVDVR